MLAIYDPRQLLHRPQTRLTGGVLKPSLELPERVTALLEALDRLGIAVTAPPDHGDDVIRATHDAGYLDFLQTAFDAWRRLPGTGPELRASLHPNEHMRRMPDDLIGRAGYYQADAGCVLVEGTWEAVRASANTAADATARVLAGAPVAYALCRPPGHHAYADKAGGFCYLNNTAVAAHLATVTGRRVAILDLDVHHGNGTQTMFYDRSDVLTVSIHGDPARLYPFYAGYADETGVGAGEGFNLNLPVPLLSGNDAYLAAVDAGIEATRRFAPDLLVVALGLDASPADPFACMQVSRDGFARMGQAAGDLGLPTVIVQEGGYLSDELGPSLEAFLRGFGAAGR